MLSQLNCGRSAAAAHLRQQRRARCKRMRCSPIAPVAARRHAGLARFSIPWCGGPGQGCADAVHLWFARLKYLRQLARLGYSPMYLDTDVTVQTNFYRCAPCGQGAMIEVRGGCRRPMRKQTDASTDLVGAWAGARLVHARRGVRRSAPHGLCKCRPR